VWITVNWGEGWWIPNPNSTVPCTGEHLERVLYRGMTIIPSGFFIREDKMAETLSGIVSTSELIGCNMCLSPSQNVFHNVGAWG